MIGWIFFIPWAHFAAHSNVIHRMQLDSDYSSSVVSVQIFTSIDLILGWLHFSSPSYTTLLKIAELVNPVFVDGVSDYLSYLPVLSQTEFLLLCFLDFERQNANETVSFFLGTWHCLIFNQQGEENSVASSCLHSLRVHDEKLALAIRSFHSSTNTELPQCRTLYIPPWSCLNPK